MYMVCMFHLCEFECVCLSLYSLCVCVLCIYVHGFVCFTCVSFKCVCLSLYSLCVCVLCIYVHGLVCFNCVSLSMFV